MLVKIFGRRCNHHALTRQPTGDQTTRAFEFSEADDEVNTFFNRVNQMVREGHRELQVRMGFRDVEKDGNEYPSTKSRGHVDAQTTDGTLKSRAESGFRGGNLVKRGCTSSKIRFAIRSERNASRGAMKELRAEAFLEFCDRLSDRRLREPELFGRVRKTARLRGGDENHDAAESIDLRHALPH